MSKLKNYIFLSVVIALVMRASSRLLRGEDHGGNPVCLTECTEIPESIEAFKKSHRLDNGRDEIDYLLFRIRTSNVKFIRNGIYYKGSDAARFLRWKLVWQYKSYHKPISTGQEFVSNILSGSKKSGRPYEIIFPDGSRYSAQLIMQNELDILNKYKKGQMSLINYQDKSLEQIGIDLCRFLKQLSNN